MKMRQAASLLFVLWEEDVKKPTFELLFKLIMMFENLIKVIECYVPQAAHLKLLSN